MIYDMYDYISKKLLGKNHSKELQMKQLWPSCSKWPNKWGLSVLELDPHAHAHHSTAAVKAGLGSPEAESWNKARMFLSVTKILTPEVGFTKILKCVILKNSQEDTVSVWVSF